MILNGEGIIENLYHYLWLKCGLTECNCRG